jgi:hypothetical protein
MSTRPSLAQHGLASAELGEARAAQCFRMRACRRAVYIGDNSNLLLELAKPTRAL